MLVFETSCLGNGQKKPEDSDNENWQPLVGSELADYVWNALVYEVSVMCSPERGPQATPMARTYDDSS